MKQLLMIGSTVADVVIRTPRLPRRGDDVNILAQQISLGGCAYNVFHTAQLTGQAQCTLFSPVGRGVWGDWVHAALAARDVCPAIPRVEESNGCCYCLVEPDGERTFLCEHGAEYRFRPEWFDLLGSRSFDGVYLCGLEVEDDGEGVILSYLEHQPPRRLYFAPGPRITHIPPVRMARVMALSPVMHLNETELYAFTQCDDVVQAAAMLRSLTQNDVIVTLGAEGAYITSLQGSGYVPGCPAPVVDTIGAGDAHIGAVMAGEAMGLSLAESVRRANRISAAVVGQAGAELTMEAWLAIRGEQ